MCLLYWGSFPAIRRLLTCTANFPLHLVRFYRRRWAYKHSQLVINAGNGLGSDYWLYIFSDIASASALNTASTFWPVFALVKKAFPLYFVASS